MSTASDLVARLAQEGIDPTLLADVARELFSGELERKALADRRRSERDRKANQRSKSRDVTGQPVKSGDTPPNDKDILTPREADPDDASASSPARQPITEAISIWNQMARATGWPTVQTRSAARDRSLSARLRQHGIEGWQAAINRARSSPYLGGADPPSWFTFNWLIRAENFLKLSEGNYDRRRSQSGVGDPTTTALQRIIGAAHH